MLNKDFGKFTSCITFGAHKVVQGVPIKNNPLEKILYLRNFSRFFFTRFMLFTEEDLGHVSSKLHLNIWLNSKIIPI